MRKLLLALRLRSLNTTNSLSSLIIGLPIQSLFVAAISLFSLKLLLSTDSLIGIGVLILAAFVCWQNFAIKKKLGSRINAFFAVASISALAVSWLTINIDPAHAQFFFDGQAFLEDVLLDQSGGDAGGAQAAIDVIFNVLRAVYLLYLAVSAIGVINAVRQDEDWQTAARTPMLVFVVVTFTDVLTRFIVGPAGGGGGGGAP
jgi:uncharacterized MAPEG superfamily protein